MLAAVSAALDDAEQWVTLIQKTRAEAAQVEMFRHTRGQA